MSAEHFQQWRHRKELEEVCKNHVHYVLYENMNPKAVSKKQYSNQQMYKKMPCLYIAKNRIIGVVLFVIRLVARIKPIYNLRLRRKYPLRLIQKN